MSNLSRREFLKLSFAAMAGLAIEGVLPGGALSLMAEQSKPNILVFLFDSMTAMNLSVYGYSRKTTPNFERFAQRATIYHRHYSGGSYTTPGTASVLTGLYPWTHRAFYPSSVIRRDMAGNNIFSLLEDGYLRAGFAQNYWADLFLNQFSEDIDKYIPPAAWSLVGPTLGASIRERIPGDENVAYRAYVQLLFKGSDVPRSLVLGFPDHVVLQYFMKRNSPSDYPMGVPLLKDYHISFINEMVFDGLRNTIESLSRNPPYLAYFHLWSPHGPYRAHKDYIGMFKADSYKPPKKPKHALGEGKTYASLNSPRRNYDEFIANVDAEFGRLIDSLESQGILENTCVMIIADHGESFERGDQGHFSPLLYEAVIRTPLLLSMPGQKQRFDVYTPTSNVDILPTLAKVTGVEIPDWSDGFLLPGFGVETPPDRIVYAMDAKMNSAFEPFTKATVAMMRGDYKLIYYRGYSGKYNDFYELYDLYNDPEELEDIYSDSKCASIASDMRAELMTELEAKNKPYQR